MQLLFAATILKNDTFTATVALCAREQKKFSQHSIVLMPTACRHTTQPNIYNIVALYAAGGQRSGQS